MTQVATLSEFGKPRVLDAADFLARIREVAGKEPGGLHEPVFAGNEKKYLSECIDTGYVSSVGAFVGAFEDSVKNFVGAQHAIATVNGTTGLHLALIAAGVSPGDEVLVPAMSFVATANAVSHASAVAHFVDVAIETWGIDPDALRQHLQAIGEARGEVLYNKHTGRPITALVPMHALGHPADIEELLTVAAEFNLVVVEDAAESLGSMVGDRHSGLFGRFGVFSFNGNKTITTGGGGVIVTDDDELAARVRHLSTTARVPHRYEFDHDEVGYNYRMPNINAALGLAQMEQLPALVAQQRQIFEKYVTAFSDWPFGHIHRERKGVTSNYWLQALTLSSEVANEKNSLITTCVDSGVSVRPLWKPLNRLEHFASHPSAKTPVTEDLYNRVICLPSSANLSAPEM